MPSSARKDRMTYWSRHDPVVMPRSNTDHWSIMRRRAQAMSEGDPRVAQSAGGIPPGVTDIRDLMKRANARKAQMMGPTGDGRVDPKGDPVFSQVPKRDLVGAAPGNYTLVRARTSGERRDFLRTSYNMKAKEGLKYWYQERPKPTSFGRYGIGSYKTVLGIGNAPRT